VLTRTLLAKPRRESANVEDVLWIEIVLHWSVPAVGLERIRRTWVRQIDHRLIARALPGPFD
jgi:hypothetical protein